MKLKIALLVLLCFSVGIAQQKDKKQSAEKGKWEELKEYPKPISPIQPEYPQIAKLAGIEGKVFIETLISETGVVLETKVMRSDHETLIGAAIAAIKTTKFSPGVNKEGKKVKTWVVIPMAFKLDDDKKELKTIVPSDNSKTNNEVVLEPDIDAFQEVEKNPEMIEAAQPEYPVEAKKNNIAGKVYVKMLVNEEGLPRKAVVIKSDNNIFNQSAIRAAMESKFTPAMQGGKPIAVWIVLPYRFALDGVKEDDVPEILQVDLTSNESYPKEAIDKGIEGNVLLSVKWGSDGKVKNAKIIESSNLVFDKFSLEWVKTITSGYGRVVNTKTVEGPKKINIIFKLK